jgi:imidazole glycerol-phosphate synthase subunit HisH
MTKSPIALIDYGAGNLTSVRKALAAVGAEVFVPAAPADLERAAGTIVPGVGHFAATRSLDDAWRAAILRSVEAGRPLLGICLGMQWLFEGSSESPELPGLGLLPGRCVRLTGEGGRLKVPHVGWNALDVVRPGALVGAPDHRSFVYFTHSYAAPVTSATGATAEHGERFAAVVEQGLVGGVQFHPEKSGDVGLRILRRFVDGCRREG